MGLSSLTNRVELVKYASREGASHKKIGTDGTKDYSRRIRMTLTNSIIMISFMIVNVQSGLPNL